MKIRPAGAELFHADGHEDADSHFFPNLRTHLLEMPNVCWPLMLTSVMNRGKISSFP